MGVAFRIAVIGVGNEFRRDDGVGWAVVARLAERAGMRPPPDGMILAACDGDPARLIALWTGADLALVVDAATSRPPRPGHVRRLEATDEQLSHLGGATSTHGLGLGEAVALSRMLGHLPRHLVVYAVEVADTGLGTGLSAPVAAVVEPLAERIAQEITLRTAGTPQEASTGTAIDRALSPRPMAPRRAGPGRSRAGNGHGGSGPDPPNPRACP
ncbi:hydrogenase maturation protease [Embleya sp. NBC_00896]|uniref:hydrogenase maturation protease n=1 Tax=Embleya sp. NBC_00896 TaxID=2975961 RepID=UPI00386E818E|nr:hydrogenase maturation protease [Embleya sp. NBC_00896]